MTTLAETDCIKGGIDKRQRTVLIKEIPDIMLIDTSSDWQEHYSEYYIDKLISLGIIALEGTETKCFTVLLDFEIREEFLYCVRSRLKVMFTNEGKFSYKSYVRPTGGYSVDLLTSERYVIFIN